MKEKPACSCAKCVERREEKERHCRRDVKVVKWHRIPVLNPQDAFRRCRIV